MIKCGQHTLKDNPPNIPMITGSYSRGKNPKEPGVGEAIADAAVAIIKALKGSPAPPIAGISPGKKVLQSGQYLKQLETIQKLKDDGLLNKSEFEAQKERIMINLSSLS